MGKAKAAKGSKPKSDVLSTVKSGGVKKSSQTPKSKSKEIAKVAAKAVADKKLKQHREQSSSSEDDSENSGSDSSEFDSDSSASDEIAPVTNGKKAGGTANDSDSSSDSESDEDDAPTVNAKVNGAKVNGAKAPASNSDSDSDADSDSDSEAEAQPKTNGAKLNGVPTAVDEDTSSSSDSSDEEMADAKAVGAKTQDDDDSGEDSDSSNADSKDDNSDSDSESEKPAAEEAPKKRKMEDHHEAPAKKAKVDDGEGLTESTNLFVGQLSWNIDDDWLASEFKDFEGFVKARVVTHKDNPSHSRGFGYVDFTTAEAAKAAMEAMQDKEIDGRRIKVDLSQSRGQDSGNQNRVDKRAKAFGDVPSPESNTLFVGNLPFEITRDDVWEFFAQTVEPKNVRLPTDPETGKLKGFGYVEFNSVEEAKSAYETNKGAVIGERDRPIRLDYAQSRPPPAGGGGHWRGGDRGGRGGRGGFGDRGGRGGGRGGRGGFGDRGGRGGRGGFGGRGRGGGRIDTYARSSEHKITFDN